MRSRVVDGASAWGWGPKPLSRSEGALISDNISSQIRDRTRRIQRDDHVNRILDAAKSVLVGLILILLGFLFLEGLSSSLLFLRDVVRTSRGALAERTHTRYDELLGWVNVENVTIENLYGDGLHLRTNSQGFRANQDYDVSPPPGKLRIICSGDSFTLGYGVDNDHTWCQLLAGSDERFETVNLGQGGYGIDQAYLWYKRDGTRLQHDVHLFSFITADFWRMRSRSFHGYAKPFLDVRNGELAVENVPVPQTGFYAPWLARNIQLVNRLRTVQLLRTLLPAGAESELPSEAQTREVLAKVIEDLNALNRSKDSILAIVLLPTQADYASNESHSLRRFLTQELNRQQIFFFDLVRDLRDLPPGGLERLFIQEGSGTHEAAGGHYSVRGNEYIADRLHERLAEIPEIAARLASQDPPN